MSATSITEIFSFFVMVVILIMYVQNYFNEVDYVEAFSDGRQYLVRKLDDKQEAAEYLATINKNLIKLTQHMHAKYSDREDTERLYKNYNKNALSEKSVDSGYTSYSINKGEKIVLCIRQTDNSFVDQNTINKNLIKYVCCHS